MPESMPPLMACPASMAIRSMQDTLERAWECVTGWRDRNVTAYTLQCVRFGMN